VTSELDNEVVVHFMTSELDVEVVVHFVTSELDVEVVVHFMTSELDVEVVVHFMTSELDVEVVVHFVCENATFRKKMFCIIIQMYIFSFPTNLGRPAEDQESTSDLDLRRGLVSTVMLTFHGDYCHFNEEMEGQVNNGKLPNTVHYY